MDAKRVLVTNCHHPVGYNISKSLEKKGVPVISSGKTKYGLTRFSKYPEKYLQYHDPHDNEDLFIKSLNKIIEENDIEVIFPVGDYTTIPISKNKDKIEKKGVIIPISDWETLNRLDDKLLLSNACKKHGVLYPYTKLVSNIDDLKRYSKDIGFPIVFKQRSQYSGAAYANNIDEAITKFNKMKRNGTEILIQEYCSGEIYTFSTVMNHGKPKCIFLAKKIDELPPSGGVCQYGVTINKPEIISSGLKLLKGVKWHGVASPEFIVNKDEIKIMEVNVRFFGYTKLAIDSGVNIPWLLYKIATNQTITPNFNYLIGKRWIRMLHSFLFVPLAGTQSQGLFSWLKNPSNFSYDILDLQDMLPFFVYNSLTLKSALLRAYKKIDPN